MHVGFRTGAVLRGVSLRIAPGEAYGLVGESGCGKSTVAAAVLRALPRGAASTGRVLVAGQDVARLDARALRRLRARRVSLVSQDPARALNPTLTAGRQVAEAFAVLGRRDAWAAAEAMLARVRLPDPARVMAAYPHQLSGGMAQRVVLAMALAKDPALLVLDEPTTALDATVAAEVLGLLDTLRRESGTALLFISHDLGAVARMCARVGVLYAGTLVEEGTADTALRHPLHPYTARLLRCRPAGRRKADGPLETVAGVPPPPGRLPPGCVFAARCDRADSVCRTVDPPAVQAAGQMALCHHPGSVAGSLPGSATGAHAGGVVLQAGGLSKRLGKVRVLTDVALTLEAGRTMGLVGESGSGKTTLARLLTGLAAPDTGEILLDGHRLAALACARPTASRRAMQMVFQNPDSALNRTHTVRRLIARPLALLAGLRGAALGTRLRALLAAVRLTEAQALLRPRQLSGGMKQRVALARALAGAPRVVVCDEPTAALDVSVQAAILNLLVELQAQDGVALLFISHDLDAVRYLADDVTVLYAGQVVQAGSADAVFAGPHHPYTAALLAAADGGGGLRDGAPAPSGCAFRLRCPQRLGPVCDTSPPLVMEAGHAIRCHIPREVLDKRRVGGDDGAIQG